MGVRFNAASSNVVLDDGAEHDDVIVVGMTDGTAKVVSKKEGLLVERDGLTGVERQGRGGTYTMTFDDGSEWTVARRKGCGCGS